MTITGKGILRCSNLRPICASAVKIVGPESEGGGTGLEGDGDASRIRDKAARGDGVRAHPAFRRISLLAEHEPVFR
jgi:hypothetical protein